LVFQRPTTSYAHDNYNAVAIGYSTTDRQKELYRHVAVYNKYVNIGFNKGTQLDDPKGLLKGTGNSIRHITVGNFAEFPEKYVRELLKQACKLAIDSLENKEQKIKGQSIIKSVSATKKRPGESAQQLNKFPGYSSKVAM
jgi:hypothetical protein